MKKILFSLCFFLLFFLCPYHTINSLAAETPSGLYARAAILLDGKNQRVLFGKEEKTELPMASTTKIMTCLYALEHGNPDDVVTFSKTAASAPKVHLGAGEGSQFLLSDLLYALMLESYNDAAVAIAEHISGSVEAFCQAMTEEAHDFGCYQTSFETPNGLDSPKHYTTCYDLAILTSHALANPEFRRIIQEPSYSIRETSGKRTWNLQNKDAFLSSYPNAIGVKTGFTSKAGYCFVGAVETDDRLLISVVLGSGWPPNRSYKWADTRKLMDYGQKNFTEKTIALDQDIPSALPVSLGQKELCSVQGPSSVRLLLSQKEKIKITTDLPAMLSAPIRKGDSVGTVTLSIDGEVYRKYPVYANISINKINYLFCLQKMSACFFLGRQNGFSGSAPSFHK